MNSNIIHDKKFRKGFTKCRLKEYGLNSDNIIFEITERVAVIDRDTFLSSIHHYKNQNYGIAIDDVGAGYSGLNFIANVRPDLIKLDMNLVRDIDKDETKQLLCKAMVDFGKNAGILLIAEGIETEDELRTLIQLNVDLGQGYFLGIPQESFQDITPDRAGLIVKYHTKNNAWKYRNSVYPIIGHLAKPGYTFSPREKAEKIYETLRLHSVITEFTVIEDVVGYYIRKWLDRDNKDN